MDKRAKLALGKLLESDAYPKSTIWRLLAATNYADIEERLLPVAKTRADNNDALRSLVDGLLKHWSPYSASETCLLHVIAGDRSPHQALFAIAHSRLRQIVECIVEGNTGDAVTTARQVVRFILLGESRDLDNAAPRLRNVRGLSDLVPTADPFRARVIDVESRCGGKLEERHPNESLARGLQRLSVGSYDLQTATLLNQISRKYDYCGPQPSCDGHLFAHIAARPLVRLAYDHAPELLREHFAKTMSKLRNPVVKGDWGQGRTRLKLPPSIVLDSLPWDDEREVHTGREHVLARRCGALTVVWRWSPTAKEISSGGKKITPAANLGTSKERYFDSDDDAQSHMDEVLTNAAGELGVGVEAAWSRAADDADEIFRRVLARPTGEAGYAICEALVRGGTKIPSQPLHLALAHPGNFCTIELLLEAGARGDAVDRRGHTPMQSALRSDANASSRRFATILASHGFGTPEDATRADELGYVDVAESIRGRDRDG